MEVRRVTESDPNTAVENALVLGILNIIKLISNDTLDFKHSITPKAHLADITTGT